MQSSVRWYLVPANWLKKDDPAPNGHKNLHHGRYVKMLAIDLDKVAVKHCLQCTTAFDIIDNEKIVLKVMNPVKPEEFFAWIFVWQKKFALELKTKFQELWANATDLRIEIA